MPPNLISITTSKIYFSLFFFREKKAIDQPPYHIKIIFFFYLEQTRIPSKIIAIIYLEFYHDIGRTYTQIYVANTILLFFFYFF